MPWSKEIQEQTRNEIVDMHQSGKGYKAISKALGLQRITVRAIIHKWRTLGTAVNLPRSGWPAKITPRAQWWVIQEVIEEPRTASKELKASLVSIKVSVHDSTIRKRLEKNSIQGRVPKQKTFMTKNNTKARLTFAKIYLDYPQDLWVNILWTDETNVELSGKCVSRYIWHKTTQHFIKRTSYQQSNMVVVVWWSGAAFQLQDLDDLP